MSLSRYSVECRGLIEELRQSLTPEDVEGLRRDLATIGQAEWTEWKARNLPHVSGYAAATPSERKKRKAWADPVLRRQLILAAIQHLELGSLLLSQIVSKGLEPGIGYRSMAAAAGDAGWNILRNDLPAWPFDGENA